MSSEKPFSVCRVFIERPVATVLLALAMVLTGIMGFVRLPVADLPNVDFPVIVVQASQPGGSPEEIASSVAAPLERHLGQIAGLSEMTSRSSEGEVRIILQFDLSRDINGAARDIQAALQASHADLPTSLRSNPYYYKANPNAAPVYVLALTSDIHTQAQMYEYASNVLVQQISQIEGVGQVDIGGSSLPAVRVELNPKPLFQYGIGFEDIRAALASANANTPKGVIDNNGVRFTLQTNDQARDAKAYRDLIIAWRNNRPVRLADVATVENNVEDIHNSGFFGQAHSVIALVLPQANANVIELIDKIRQKIPLMRSALPGGVDLHIGLDRSLTIRAALADTEFTLIISVILVTLVVLAFLNSLRMTLIPALVVPTSIISTFAVMWLLGYSLNNMSLMALTVSTGFVVDDAIVVVENIARYLEKGFSPREASQKGCDEVAFTVVSISISLIAVFIPIMFLSGLSGRLFHEFTMTLTVSIFISMILSLTLTPMMASQLLKAHDETGKKLSPPLQKFIDIILCPLNWIERVYASTLEIALQHRRITLWSLPASFILIAILLVSLPKGFIPTSDTGLVIGHVKGSQSISFAQLSQKLLYIQKIIGEDPDVEDVASFVGGQHDALNAATMFLRLKDKTLRPDTGAHMITRIEKKLKKLVGAELFLVEPGTIHSSARQSDGSYQYTLQGGDAQELYQWTKKLTAELQRHKQLQSISSDVDEGAPAIGVHIARDTAARFNLTPQMISNTLYDAFGQRAVSIIYNSMNQYRVIMEANPLYWSSPEMLKQVWVSVSGGSAGGGTKSNTIRVRKASVTSSSGGSGTTEADLSQASFKNQIANSLAGGTGASNGSAVSTSKEAMLPLTFVSQINDTIAPLTVNHLGQSVATTISFNLADHTSLSQAIHIIRRAELRMHMPHTIRGSFIGNAAQLKKSGVTQSLTLIAALAAVYITLGILYESYIHPLTILSTLPSASLGALIALRLFGQELSLVAGLAIIILIGIVKKNAIMLVDFALDTERTDGTPALQAIKMACLLRFRPIFMTTLAAACGALPLALAHGYGYEIRRPVGIALMGGLILSQALTLYTTPVVYLLLDKLRMRPKPKTKPRPVSS